MVYYLLKVKIILQIYSVKLTYQAMQVQKQTDKYIII
ncbi:hypothetical protein Mucpa_1596 [Mucilaginibacter paludis DSM 18603]|uniref:Uncharacterized protein n=1 Tax=Mucilaginibacter paludis DSM 18603 TaxID=714943 RepID=H1Y4B9_9SPHI|nr:hypothetical protein Mucpa_1498 [Mucilaginibacter paludis DSM 18603]EHQ25753.1 hypothetical protein Mucpa_1596 [Mucilaginibacter paludis DSM 18603]